MTTRENLLMVLLLKLTLSLASTEASVDETPTAYEMLERFDFPKGILPVGARNYTLDKDGSFEVFLAADCEFAVDGGYLLRYNRRIAGKVESGSLTELGGVRVKVLFAWLGINGVVRNDADLNFFVGPISASFPISNFEESPRCRCGFNCAAAAAAAAAFPSAGA